MSSPSSSLFPSPSPASLSLISTWKTLLYKLSEEFYFDPNDTQLGEQIIQLLQANDCRDILTNVMVGDHVANAFVQASAFGQVELVQSLVENGLPVDIKNRSGITALMHASYSGRIEVVQWLLTRGVNVDEPDVDGASALFHALYQSKTNVAELLLEKNANVDFQDNNGWTVLMAACTMGSVHDVEFCWTAVQAWI